MKEEKSTADDCNGDSSCVYVAKTLQVRFYHQQSAAIFIYLRSGHLGRLQELPGSQEYSHTYRLN